MAAPKIPGLKPLSAATKGQPLTTEEIVLRSLFEAATRDLHAPPVLRRHPTPAPGPTFAAPRKRRRLPLAGVATAAAAALITVLGFGVGAGPGHGGHPANPGAGTAAAPTAASGSPTLYHLAAAIRALPAPAGRYAVQIERQREGATSYLKATIIDSRTGNTWTYQRGPGVPAVLPMAPGFSPTEAQLQSGEPTDPTRLKAALVAQASAGNPHLLARQTPADLAVTQAIDTLWNPLVQPALRSALVAVIAASPGVRTDGHATDSQGRRSIEISYRDAGLGMQLSVHLDPSTGTVLESSEQPYTTAADPSLAGHDVYESRYWTNASPTVDPLTAPAQAGG